MSDYMKTWGVRIPLGKKKDKFDYFFTADMFLCIFLSLYFYAMNSGTDTVSDWYKFCVVIERQIENSDNAKKRNQDLNMNYKLG